jgi:hypothetical protein
MHSAHTEISIRIKAWIFFPRRDLRLMIHQETACWKFLGRITIHAINQAGEGVSMDPKNRCFRLSCSPSVFVIYILISPTKIYQPGVNEIHQIRLVSEKHFIGVSDSGVSQCAVPIPVSESELEGVNFEHHKHAFDHVGSSFKFNWRQTSLWMRHCNSRIYVWISLLILSKLP